MAKEAAAGRLTRDAQDDVYPTEKAANQSRRVDSPSSSFTEAGRISAMFGTKLEQRMNAYNRDLSDFGCPGNTVDHWRVQFTGKEAAPRAANGKTTKR